MAKILVVILALATTILDLFFLIWFISPTLFLKVGEMLPAEVQEIIATDFLTSWLVGGNPMLMKVIILSGISIGLWFLSSRMKVRKSLYRRVRFRSPTGVTSIGWFLAIVGTVATIYILLNWNYVDHTVAVLVITANAFAILWNLGIIG